MTSTRSTATTSTHSWISDVDSAAISFEHYVATDASGITLFITCNQLKMPLLVRRWLSVTGRVGLTHRVPLPRPEYNSS